jgi:hypothetical protein
MTLEKYLKRVLGLKEIHILCYVYIFFFNFVQWAAF